jgi:dGTPase
MTHPREGRIRVVARKQPSRPCRDDRFYSESSQDDRTRFQRDRDRVLYTSAFHRLAGITQVASADEGHVFHNRLTHTLEVAQVARRIAEKLILHERGSVEKIGGLDPDVAETCALVNDLGHPPFGHIAEKELDQLVSDPKTKGNDPDGFEGNAQSFRIVNRLALRSFNYDGLNLTRATLNGTLKYPWLREIKQTKNQSGGKKYTKKHKKWSSYRSESDRFKWARELVPSGDESKSLEAQIMDWADDVTYAVHDVSDFFKAGLVPLDRLLDGSSREKARFYDSIFARTDWVDESGFSRQDLEIAFDKLIQFFPLEDRYTGTDKHRRALRSFTAAQIAECVKSVHLDVPKKKLIVPPRKKKEIAMLKQLTWHYVILNASLTTKQFGQRKIIRDLFEVYHKSAVERDCLELFPTAYRELVNRATFARERTRLVADMIAGMTEQQAISIHRKLTGVNLGSVLDHMAR